jgi:D-alanyl-D-alanine carboxypeptidase
VTTRLAALLLALIAILPARAANAAAYILIDVRSGAVLAADNAHQVWYPASLAKLMTAHLAFRALEMGALRLTSPVVVSANAAAEPPSKMGYRAGTILTVDNALKMMLVKSANDIAMAVGETIGGTEAGFVALMNAEARRLGMNSTEFRNPNGLPQSGQVTTARDLAVLARAILLDHPQYSDYFGYTAILAGGTVMPSQNDLLERYPGATGMKTGFICSSGYNLVASAERAGQGLIAVVLGATSSEERARLAAALLDQGFLARGAYSQAVDTYVGASPSPTPADLRSVVCAEGLPPDGNIEAGSDDPNSSLGPRVAIMQPVQVSTGGADAQAPAIAFGVPLPRPRPASPLGYIPAGPMQLGPGFGRGP